MNILGVIPARAGSKRVKNKNIRPFAGKTLTNIAIEQAMKAKLLDKIIISSDSKKILSIGKSYKNIDILNRPVEIAGDNSPAIDYMNHVVSYYESKGWSPDLLVIIQPTSPIRSGVDIDNTIKYLKKDPTADSSVSIIKLPHHVHPHKFKILKKDILKPWQVDEGHKTAQQDLPNIYIRNCAVYVFRVKNIKKGITYGKRCIGYRMNEQSGVDINDELDFKFAEYLFEKYD